MSINIKNWGDFQHYKNRNPPWIKLYRRLLDDPEWHTLSPGASKALVGCWLVAAESEGELPKLETLAFRLRIDAKLLATYLSELKHWVTVGDSTVLASCRQSACSETETETETETEDTPQKVAGKRSKQEYSESFLEFWELYPLRSGKKVGKKTAFAEWKKTKSSRPDNKTMLEILQRHKTHWSKDQNQFVPDAERWLKKHGWEDELQPTQAGLTYMPV